MQQVRTSVWPNLLKFINGFSSNQDFRVVKSVSDFGLTKASPDFTARSVSSLVKKVRSKIGSPITGYGQESRHRAARQRIPNKVWTDDNGIEHVEINFYIRGLHGAGKFYTEMFKDKEYRKWKYTVLVVEIRSPTQSNIILESYLPSLKTT